MTVLVTGGGGFLGRAIVERLLERGWRVRSYARGDYPELRRLGVDVRRGDVVDADALRRAFEGCDAVVHTAARVGLSVRPGPFERTNFAGTRVVIEACRSAGVTRLVHTSSPSVVFDGRDMAGVDESVPYPPRYAAHYPRTKAAAERLVLAANGAPGRDGTTLRTVALRPHLIWGPRDRHLVPRILRRARRLRRLGRANKPVDSTYIDNAADAHVLALERLSAGSPPAGRAYFISNGEPRPVWDLVNGILAAGGLPPVTRRVPLALARAVGAACELACRLLPGDLEPPMTRFLACELSTAHWFDISAARRDLGYAPRVTIDEGLARLTAWLHVAGSVGERHAD